MTICIAAICERGGSIVAAFDRMITWPRLSTAADNIGFKFDVLDKHWFALVAGDMASVDPITDIVRESIVKHRNKGTHLSVRHLESYFSDAYVQMRKSTAETGVLGVYGLTMEQFIQGRKLLGEQVYQDLYNKIEGIECGCEFLVAGFDDSSIAEIFQVHGNGMTSRQTRTSFAAIGSGLHHALSSLTFNAYSPESTSEEAAYLVSQAKFMAESAPGVGRTTLIMYFKLEGSMGVKTDEGCASIRDFWEKEIKITGVPDKALKVMRDATWHELISYPSTDPTPPLHNLPKGEKGE